MSNKNSAQFILRVNQLDQPLGLIEKYEAHRNGILHRAFSVFLFRRLNSSLQLLLHQRTQEKYHSGGLWTNTCCSHAKKATPLENQAKNRLKIEMGFSCKLYHAGLFYYKENVGNEMIEHEIDHVFVGLHNPRFIRPNPQEVQNYKWIDVEALQSLSQEEQKKFTAWFFQAFELALKSIKTMSTLNKSYF
ncbi:NUDIX domain-containing protein [Candidatus Rhabdochlamydia sp. T3358]|uniref:isopentenyl-diphosphate Delta-isomerase n=1 Tax=Candidatus Rhabdochlamydia sp. T3358 TaxID=2099795 RepID=UPI0014855AE9|nr:NUDIX domain-containing protein [Candidatus Rhabdochlamydia sp. T3358]